MGPRSHESVGSCDAYYITFPEVYNKKQKREEKYLIIRVIRVMITVIRVMITAIKFRVVITGIMITVVAVIRMFNKLVANQNIGIIEIIRVVHAKITGLMEGE